jgi:predicted nucleic acid-binding protein
MFSNKFGKIIFVKPSVSDVKVYDAKIAAAMKSYNVRYLLTFNAKDFIRYSDIKGIEPKGI